ncbi:MAG: hypothetical protein GXY81_08605 [Candidatus Cloacimonetes bacterium]|nr:hypothetical protein [Candidatus Cloacimonadota bacterium]
MLKKQSGNAIFWVISALLAIALILVLALPGKYKLDPEKNTDDCTTYMKNIWVAIDNYMQDFQKDFEGDLDVLRNTNNPNGKGTYLSEERFCPELQGEKKEYIAFGKHLTEVVEGETKHYSGIMVLCPNLDKYAKHLLDKNFYDNMSTSKLQNFMVNDLVKIDAFTKSNAKMKNEYMTRYMEYWKNTKHTEFNAAINDPTFVQLRKDLTGEQDFEPEDNVYEE